MTMSFNEEALGTDYLNPFLYGLKYLWQVGGGLSFAIISSFLLLVSLKSFSYESITSAIKGD